MQSAIISVKLHGREQEYDLEVPAEIPSQQLAELITHNLSSGTVTMQPFVVRCLKPAALRRQLRAQESLAEAGMWDGTYLEIGPVDTTPSKEWGIIVERWEPLLLGDIRDNLPLDEQPYPAESLERKTDPESPAVGSASTESRLDDDGGPDPPDKPDYVWKQL